MPVAPGRRAIRIARATSTQDALERAARGAAGLDPAALAVGAAVTRHRR